MAPDPFMLSLVCGAANKPVTDLAPGDTTASTCSFFGPFYVLVRVLCTRCNLFARLDRLETLSVRRMVGVRLAQKHQSTCVARHCGSSVVYYIFYDCSQDINRISLCSEQE
jgi:hypothetical protein